MKHFRCSAAVRRLARRVFLCGIALALLQTVRADLYAPGDTVTNLMFIARRAFTRPDGTLVPVGAQVGIQDLAGRILFLGWFAVWCPFCQAAVPQVDAGITDWYESRGGTRTAWRAPQT